MEWFVAIEEDKVYQALLKDLKQCHHEIMSLDNKIRALIRDIVCLDSLEDLSINIQCDTEEPSSEEDELLTKITGMESEGWWHRHHRGQELCKEMMVSKCIEVANITALITAAKGKRDGVIMEKDRYREEFQIKFNAKEEK